MNAISTPRLQLVPVTLDNAGELWDVLQLPDLRTFQDLPEMNKHEFERLVAARPTEIERGSSGRFEWLVYLGGIAEPVGWVSLRIGDRSTTTAEVGYSVTQKYRGRGIATEAVRALVNEGFRSDHIRRVRAYCVPENTPSRALLLRIGFRSDGVLPHGATVRGRAVDVLAYVVERDEWQRMRAAVTA